MRPALFVLCAVSVAACEPEAKIRETTVQWMDWPAEVAAATPFDVRLVVFPPCVWDAFRAAPSADESAVTFAPYFFGERQDVLCGLRAQPVSIIAAALDTIGRAPGLPADFSRTYEIRASTSVSTGGALRTLPVRTFGDVVVRPANPDGSRRNAGGYVFLEVDTLGCARIRPLGLFTPDAPLVLANQTDTAGLTGAFVRGYIHTPAAPVCGETTVFQVTSVN